MRLVGYLKKKCNWKIPKRQWKEFFPLLWPETELEETVDRWGRRSCKKYCVDKIPVFSCALIPVGSSSIGWNTDDCVQFQIEGTDEKMLMESSELSRLLADIARDHRHFLRGDGKIRVTLTLKKGAYVKPRLLTSDDELERL